MSEVTSLIVISTNRGAYAADDIVAGMKWSCGMSKMIVVVDTQHSIAKRSNNDYTLLRSEEPAAAGFHRAVGVHWAIQAGHKFKQAILLDDECLVMGKGLDKWVEDKLVSRVGVLGVHDRNTYDDAYPRCVPLLAEWKLPYSEWGDPGRHTLHDGFIAIAGSLAVDLYERQVLCPPGVDRWELGFGTYVSWVAQMCQHYQLGWGDQDRQLPPLYVGAGRQQPPPHVLSHQFLLYRGARAAAGFSEEELRETYKRHRGEPGRIIPPVKPVVSGHGVGDPPT